MRSEGKCLRLASPRAQGVFLPPTGGGRAGSSARCALPRLLLSASRGRGRVARTGLRKVLSVEISPPAGSRGCGQLPSQERHCQQTAGASYVHPAMLSPPSTCQTGQALPSLLANQTTHWLSTFTQRRKLRPKEVARRGAGQAESRLLVLVAPSGACACRLLSEPASLSVRWGHCAGSGLESGLSP